MYIYIYIHTCLPICIYTVFVLYVVVSYRRLYTTLLFRGKWITRL